jgi:DNA helicase II / ATP-dependent DNA helicase PcrA
LRCRFVKQLGRTGKYLGYKALIVDAKGVGKFPRAGRLRARIGSAPSMDFLQGLNPQQREAAAHVEGSLLILAGAGSGKTRVITHRIAHLIHGHRIPAYSILAVTFTNKAADEMRQRIQGLLNRAGDAGSPGVSTFHSFCVRLLRRDGDRLAPIRPGFSRTFTIYDDDDQLSVIKGIYRDLGLDEKFLPYRGALSRISHAKNTGETPQDFYRNTVDPVMSRLAVIYERYENRLRQANALDFDDLLLESVRLLRHDAELRDIYNSRIRFLMVDEYQDTNRSQYDLIRLLTEKHRNVAVVGDEDQSIYGWRGADIQNILDFERDFPNARVIRLEQNYRSTRNILEGASAVVANNTARKGKWLWTESGAGELIRLYDAPDAENEALFIADTIERLLGRDSKDRVAVLYRTNFQSRQIEEALRRYGRKYIVVGGFSFYQRAEIKDILCYLKVAGAPHDSVSLLRIINTPARGIGKTTIEQIEKYALDNNLSVWGAIRRMVEEHAFPGRAEAALGAFIRLIEELQDEAKSASVHQLIKLVLDRTGYQRMLETDQTPEAESRLGNLNELLNAAADAGQRGESLTDFLDHAALVSDADAIDSGAQVSLLTMHNAKGLEFPIVFIAGMEEGLFPHSRSVNDPRQMEEERRLCYVGMTRAEKRLYLSWAQFRRRYGGGQPERSTPSRFLKEVPETLLERLNGGRPVPQVDLTAERSYVRDSAKRNLYTGKTYNSVEHISQFFAQKGMPLPAGLQKTSAGLQKTVPAAPAKTTSYSKPAAAPPKSKPFALGSTIRHPKYGVGKVMRKEGEGEDAKLTISFQGHGLKKLVVKYAGIQTDE